MAAPRKFHIIYDRISSRCLCADFNEFHQSFKNIISRIRSLVLGNTDTPDGLLSLSILRLLGEIVNMPTTCGKMVQLFDSASGDIMKDLICGLELTSVFSAHLCKKILCLICKHKRETTNSIVKQICKTESTATNNKVEALTCILTINCNDSLNLAGEDLEWLFTCKNVVSRNESNSDDSKNYKSFEETIEIVYNWLFSSSKFNGPILELILQIISITLQAKQEKYVSMFFDSRNNLLQCDRSQQIWLRIFKSVLSSENVSSELCECVSANFLANFFEGFVQKAHELKMGTHTVPNAFIDCIGSDVFCREVILCTLCALLKAKTSKWVPCLGSLRALLIASSSLQPDAYESSLISLFIEQDDQIVDIILHHLDLYIQKETDISEYFCPFKLMLVFVGVIAYDEHVVLDMLMSNETRMLLLLVRWLKLVITEWDIFVKAQQSPLTETTQELDLQGTMSMLIRLNLKVERMQEKKIFPYNVKPLLKLLNKCEECFESM